MVRTQSPPVSFRLDLSRILGYSTAIALHLLALALLLIPLSHRMAAPPAPHEQPRLRIIESHPAPPSPPAHATNVLPKPTPVHSTIQRQVAVPTPVPLARPREMPIEPPAGTGAVTPQAATATTSSSESTAETAAPQVSKLQYLQAPAPRYPSLAIRRHLEGTVVLRVLVGIDGHVRDVQIEHSSGHRVLDMAAREQVLRHWRFRPALVDGHAGEAYGLVPINFSLQ